MTTAGHHAAGSELGEGTQYDPSYNPARLYPIPRAAQRKTIGIDVVALPFFGLDRWHHYEVSWLNEKGKPMVATAAIEYDCGSPCIVESKSLKLYFNSLNNTPFTSLRAVEKIIQQDLENIIDAPVSVLLHPLGQSASSPIQAQFSGEYIDDLDITCTQYTVDPTFLSTSTEQVEETLCSDLLKSNCPVTQQPDWGSLQITYTGPKINREGLLRYIVSYRNHNDFHEHCIERIFMDIMTHCKPSALTVYGRYTRRGGIDINPYRSTHPVNISDINLRLIRQ